VASRYRSGHDSFLQYPCFQPAPDQADQARISDAVLHELEEPVVVETAEEVLQIRLELSTLPEDIGFDRLVGLAKLRWRIARDYQELKQELPTALFTGSALPVDFRPRGAPNPARTARAELDRQYPSASHRRSCQDAPQMPCCNSPIQNLRKIPVTDAVRLVVREETMRSVL
jgi:hypothetical protein